MKNSHTKLQQHRTPRLQVISNTLQGSRQPLNLQQDNINGTQQIAICLLSDSLVNHAPDYSSLKSLTPVNYISQNTARGAWAVLGSLGRGAVAAFVPLLRVGEATKPLDNTSEGGVGFVSRLVAFRRARSGWVMASTR